ncbi:response regulator, partial [Xanthomonas vasicola]
MLLVENSRTFTSMLREAIEQRVELAVTVVSTLAEAARVLDEEDGWFLVLTGLVLVDGDRDKVVEFFLSRKLPTVVVSGVYDEDLRQRVLQQQIIDYVLKNAPGSIEYLAWLVQRLERNRRIAALVVDDSLSARTYAGALLSMYGYRVVLAADGAAGLEAIEHDPDIRLTIVDQEMPGMDGVEFTRRLRAIRSRDKVAVIGISGNSDSSLIPRFLKNGANDFRRKPFSREEFFCRVSQNVDQLERFRAKNSSAACRRTWTSWN